MDHPHLNFGFVLPCVLSHDHGVLILTRRLLQPGLQRLLVPVHLRLEVLQALRLFEDVVFIHVLLLLEVVQLMLQPFDLLSEPTLLTLRDLMQMLLCLDLFFSGVEQPLDEIEKQGKSLLLIISNSQAIVKLTFRVC